MKNGDTFTALISSLNPDGLGVVEVGGVEVLIPGATPGQQVEAIIEHVGSGGRRAWARLVHADGPGVARVAPCPHAAPTRGACGGCPLMHLPPEVQREAKRQGVDAALAPLRLPPLAPLRTRGPELGYRCRSNFIAVRDAAGAIRLGSRVPRGEAVATMEGCAALRAPLPGLIAPLAALLTAAGVPVDPEPDGLRYLGLRASPRGEALVELIVRDEAAPWLGAAAAQLLALPGVVGVTASGNPSAGNALRVAPARLLAGSASVEEVIAGVPLAVSAEMFTQLNIEVASAMAEAVAARAPADARVIWDLYCGAGVLGLATARGREGAEVFGAEVHAAPTRLAADAAARLGQRGAWEARDLALGPPPGWPRPDVVLVNPPRRGLDGAVVSALIDLQAPVVYMSCNPASFARDVARLVAAGFTLDALEGWDMLPQTAHVELVGRLRPPDPAR